MNNKFLILLASVFISAGAIADNGIQYNYAEFRFIVDAELDESNVDGDGFAVGGSFRIDELLYAIADYESLDYDDNIGTDIFQVGAGAIFPYQKVDLITEVALLDFDIDGDNARDSDVGFRLAAGARGYVIPKLEVRGTLNYFNADEDDAFVTFGADYFFHPSFSVNVSKDLGSDIDRLAVGVRYYYGK